MTFAHLGHMLATYRTNAGHTLETTAQKGKVTVATWRQFEETGTGVGPGSIGHVTEWLNLDKEVLAELDDPTTVLGLVWGPELGQLVREHRALEPLDALAVRTGVSRATIVRWERAVTRPRNTAQLGMLLAALNIDPMTALHYALWPPRAMMIERPPLGESLKQWRETSKRSTRDAGELFGVGQAVYHAWERGRNNPSRPFWGRIGDVLSMSVTEVEQLLAPKHVDTYGLDERSTRLVKQRLASFTTRRSVAVKAGLTENQVAQYELGRSQPNVRRFAKYATALGLDPMDAALERMGATHTTATFGQFLKATRLARGLTVHEAAAQLGTTNTQLCKWESDRCFPVTEKKRTVMVNAFATVYGYTPNDLRDRLARTTPVVDPFATWLSDRMTRRELSTVETARRLNVTPQRVHAWATGHDRPGTRYVPSLAKVVGVPVREVRDQLATPRLAAA